MTEIINKTKGIILLTYPILISLMIMMTGFCALMFSGCIDLEAKADTKVDTKVEAKVETKVEAKGIDASNNSKKEAKMDIKNSGSQIEKQNQTANIGAFSGGSPYLLAVIVLMLYYNYRTFKKINIEKEDHKKTIEMVEEVFAKMNTNDAKISQHIKEKKTALIKK